MDASQKKDPSPPSSGRFRSHPAVWQKLDSLEQSRAHLQSIERPSGSLEPLGVVGLTSLLTAQATPQEQDAWTAECSLTPEAQELWQRLEGWHQERDGLAQDRAALLDRGAEVAAALPALPADFWHEGSSVQAQEHLPIASSVDKGPSLDAPNGPALDSPDASSAWSQPPQRWAMLGATLGMMSLGVLGWLFVSWMPGLWQPGSVDVTSPIHPRQRVRAIAIGPAQVHSKGGDLPALHFSLFIRREQQVTKVKATRKARVGEQLRFLYRYIPAPSAPARSLFLLLFMIDQQGKLSPLYPANPRGVFRLGPTSQAFLPTGAVLEQLDGPERIYVCVSTQHLRYQELRAFLRRTLQARSIRLIRRLPTSCIYQRTWLLELDPPKLRK